MEEIKPFKLVFLLDAPLPAKGEGTQELAKALGRINVGGLLNFLDPPRTIRRACHYFIYPRQMGITTGHIPTGISRKGIY